MEGQIKPHIYMPTTQLFLDQVFPSNPQGADDKNARLIFLCKCGEPPYVKSNSKDKFWAAEEMYYMMPGRAQV